MVSLLVKFQLPSLINLNMPAFCVILRVMWRNLSAAFSLSLVLSSQPPLGLITLILTLIIFIIIRHKSMTHRTPYFNSNLKHFPFFNFTMVTWSEHIIDNTDKCMTLCIALIFSTVTLEPKNKYIKFFSSPNIQFYMLLLNHDNIH